MTSLPDPPAVVISLTDISSAINAEHRAAETAARWHHHDVGGSHEAMLRVTAAADWLRANVRGLAA